MISMPTAKNMRDVATNYINCDSHKNKVEESAVERCVQLLEHAGECRAQGLCVNGLHCYRACRVLLHNRACRTKERCPICCQLKPLCHLHAHRCQKKDKSCKMPFCPNGKDLLQVVHLIRSRTNEASVTRSREPCVSAILGSSSLTPLKSADSFKCLRV